MLWTVLPGVLPWTAADNKLSREGTKLTGDTTTNPSHPYPPALLITWSFRSTARRSLRGSRRDVSLDSPWGRALVNKCGGEAPSRRSSVGAGAPGGQLAPRLCSQGRAASRVISPLRHKAHPRRLERVKPAFG